MLRREKVAAVFCIVILCISLFAAWWVERRENQRVSRIIEAPAGTISTESLDSKELRKAVAEALE